MERLVDVALALIVLSLIASGCSNEAPHTVGVPPSDHSAGVNQVPSVAKWRLLHTEETTVWGTTLATHQEAYDWNWSDGGIEHYLPAPTTEQSNCP